jgi:hypothetical protein
MELAASPEPAPEAAKALASYVFAGVVAPGILVCIVSLISVLPTP